MITRRCDLKHTPEMSPWIFYRFKVACIVDHLHIALECRVTTAGQIIPQGPLHTFIDSIRSYRISLQNLSVDKLVYQLSQRENCCEYFHYQILVLTLL